MLSVGVILVSLIVSALVLPKILMGLDFPAGHGDPETERRHQMGAARAALVAAEAAFDAMPDRERLRDALDRVMDRYRPILEVEATTDEERIGRAREESAAEARMTLAAVRAMRNYYFEAQRRKAIDQVFANAEIHALDLAETRLVAGRY